MNFLLKLWMVLLLIFLTWTIHTSKPFAALSVTAAILCLAKACQLLTPPEDKP